MFGVEKRFFQRKHAFADKVYAVYIANRRNVTVGELERRRKLFFHDAGNHLRTRTAADGMFPRMGEKLSDDGFVSRGVYGRTYHKVERSFGHQLYAQHRRIVSALFAVQRIACVRQYACCGHRRRIFRIMYLVELADFGNIPAEVQRHADTRVHDAVAGGYNLVALFHGNGREIDLFAAVNAFVAFQLEQLSVAYVNGGRIVVFEQIPLAALVHGNHRKRGISDAAHFADGQRIYYRVDTFGNRNVRRRHRAQNFACQRSENICLDAASQSVRKHKRVHSVGTGVFDAVAAQLFAFFVQADIAVVDERHYLLSSAPARVSLSFKSAILVSAAVSPRSEAIS